MLIAYYTRSGLNRKLAEESNEKWIVILKKQSTLSAAMEPGLLQKRNAGGTKKEDNNPANWEGPKRLWPGGFRLSDIGASHAPRNQNVCFRKQKQAGARR